ncbi:MAG: ABC transporter ATP-binding protein [Anaerolineae bacterium]|nr:ABC transporter ATP-binding protein [Gloeobacterales cyanobacterium ES-bin-313]
MTDPVIRVENLSKKYLLGRQSQKGQMSLRDTMTDAVKSLSAGFFKPSRRVVDQTTEEFWALKDISFEVKQGDKVGIIGRNGAGKSTLLKLLSRITEPTSGRISILGRVASLLEVGTGFHPELTGRENVFLNGSILGMGRTEIKRKFDEIVAFAEVEQFMDTPVKRYSSGMYVRLAFAVAAHLEPEVLIVDEVLAVGDVQFQKKCLGKMQEVGQEGRTVIFVSHNMQAIRRLCSSAVYMEKGKAESYANVEAALERYAKVPDLSEIDIDLSERKRLDTLGKHARLLRLRVAPGSSLNYGDRLELIFTIECMRPIDSLTIGIGFDTQEGNRVMTLDSDHNNFQMDMHAGIHEVCFSLGHNPLHPSIYSLATALMSQSILIDFIPNAATWEIGSGATDTVGDRGFGGCRLPLEVTLL